MAKVTDRDGEAEVLGRGVKFPCVDHVVDVKVAKVGHVLQVPRFLGRALGRAIKTRGAQEEVRALPRFARAVLDVEEALDLGTRARMDQILKAQWEIVTNARLRDASMRHCTGCCYPAVLYLSRLCHACAYYDLYELLRCHLFAAVRAVRDHGVREEELREGRRRRRHDSMMMSRVCCDNMSRRGGASYRRLSEELILGVILAEDETRVGLDGPAGLNLQHRLVVLQAPLWADARARLVQSLRRHRVTQGARVYRGRARDGPP